MSGEESLSVSVTSGVPQGAVLGPLLFLIHINDLPNSVSSSISLFADDSNVYRRIRNTLYCKQLQKDLHNLVKWEKEWSMEFDTSKFKVLIATNKIKPVQRCYKTHGIYLENVTQQNYLGVMLHRKLSWKPHVLNVAQLKLIQPDNIYFLQQNLSTCSRDIKLNSYKTHVRLIVEYASTVWDQNSKDLQCKAESVQHKTAHWITNNWRCCSSPTKMLQELGPKKLQERSIAKMKMLHNFYHGYKFVTSPLSPSKSQNANLRFKPILGCVRSKEGSFSISSVSLWNKFPPHIANTISMEQLADYVSDLDLLQFA